MNLQVEKEIAKLADKYKLQLEKKFKERKLEMKKDDISHYMIYSILGIDKKIGQQIDAYQNLGRFVYNHAGSFLETASLICFKSNFPKSKEKFRIPNTISDKPKTFEIDCLINKNAYEIKWRDSTTDGDHINKENMRIQVIKKQAINLFALCFFFQIESKQRKFNLK